MALRSVFKLTEKWVIDNSPTVLSALAVTGVVATTYLTGKATFKAAEILAMHEEELENFEPDVRPDYTTKDKVKDVWKEYIPPALTLASTVGFIVLSNRISASRLAALAGAYKLSEKQIAEYKDKIVEKFGAKSAEEVDDELAKARMDRVSPPSEMEIYQGMGLGTKTWCFDIYSGRYFLSDMQTLRSVANDINRQLIDDSYVRLSEWYDRLGLPETKMSGELGWTLDQPLDLKFSTQLADGNGGVPVLVVDFTRNPTSLRGYRHFPDCENPY
jgi:hypothetical protein